MHQKLYWGTVAPILKYALLKLMSNPLFQSFRLVGGTALSLQIGHRISIDIDLFTDAAYDSIDFTAIDKCLRQLFSYVTIPDEGPVGLGRSYFIGSSETDAVKLDLFYTDPFIQTVLLKEEIRMATIEEIIAMKIDIIQRKGRKKDFWDLHELSDHYTPDKMIFFHQQRYPYSQDEHLIRTNFTDFSLADTDTNPNCLKGKHWELVKLDFLTLHI